MSGNGATVIEFDGTNVRLSARVRGRGPCVLLLHGFPDTFDTWGSFASGGKLGLQDRLVAAGYRTIALAMRGYVPSGIPTDGDYSVHALADDVIVTLDRFGVEKGLIVGHDWGASAAYAAAALHPGRIERMVALAIPPFPVLPSGWRERFARPHNVTLAQGKASAWLLRRDGTRMVDRLYRSWSPHWDVPADYLAAVRSALAPVQRARAAVGYYSAPFPTSEREAIVRPIAVPTLAIYGKDEPRTRREAFGRALPYLEDGSRVEALSGVGHWPHAEAPDRVGDLVTEWFQ